MKSKSEKPRSELKLLIKEENRPLLEEIAANMSDSSLTSALNFVLEAEGETVLERLKAMKGRKRSNTNLRQSPSATQIFVPQPQTSIPELDGDTVGSAFD